MIEIKGLEEKTKEHMHHRFTSGDKALPELYARGLVADCKCGKTAVKVKYSTDTYHCMACNSSFLLEA